MQFTFKRPQTSKSVSTFYRDKYKDKSIPKNTTELPQVNTMQDNQAELVKKWEAAAQKINKQMVIQRILHSNGQPFRMLSKVGGKVYNSQPKLIQTEENNKNRIRISSKEKKSRQLQKESRIFKQIDEEPLKSSQQSGLKRKKRNQNFRTGINLEKQLKITNIFYESPVIKIGYNMQFQSYLRFEHISHIRPDHGGTICRNSIIFFFKDAPFNPNIISEMNQQIPISLSLFPEFFDSKLSLSHQKRKVYLQRMISNMNGTYDPQRMSMMPRYSSYPAFNQQDYFRTAQSLVTSNQQNYKAEWIQNISKRLHINLNQYEFKNLLHQQWSFFNLANAMCTLDYILKDQKMIHKLKISPYMNTRVITSRNILYHGGYCKSIYESWNSYVQAARKKLVLRMKKYNSTTQAIYGWYINFQQLILYQSNFVTMLEESINVQLFKKIQLAKIKFSLSILQHIWFRGVLTLYHHNRLLLKREKQYDHLMDYDELLGRYIKQAKERAKDLKNVEQINNFYVNFYQNFINSLHKQSNICSLDQLKIGFEGQITQPPQLKNIQILLNIQLGNTIQRSFYSLKQQILNFTGQPLIKLSLIIDRQSIKFLQQQEEITNSFIQIIKGILNISIEGYDISLNFDLAADGKKPMRKNDLFWMNDKPLKSVKSSQATIDISDQIRQYRQIFETQNNNSLEEDRKLNVQYRTAFIFDQDIQEIINQVKEYYQDCYTILTDFQMYLPFIKLTTNQKIFNEAEGSSLQQSFLKNLKIIARYKQGLAKLSKQVKVNIFQVNCQIPIRILQERINQIEYIIGQNYMNSVHEKIESMDQELSSLKNSIHELTLTPSTLDQMQETLIKYRQDMRQLHLKSKKIAEMIMFCLDNRRKIQTIITCYQQLVLKKQDLHRDIDKIFNNLELKKPEIQTEIQQEMLKILKDISRVLAEVNQIQTACLQIASMPEYLVSLQQVQEQMTELSCKIGKYQQSSRKAVSSKHGLQEKIACFLREQQRFGLIKQYWQYFFAFTSYFKKIAKQQIKKIKYEQFLIHVDNSERVLQKIKLTQKQWWERLADKTQWKPIIHHNHDYYSKKFAADVDTCRHLQAQLQILTNHKIRDRHWTLYNLQELKDIVFRDLTKLQQNYRFDQLAKMHEQVNFEYQIYLAYQDIERQIRGHKLLIVDLNKSDVLDLQNLSICIEFLYNIEIQIEQLIAKDVNNYYQKQLKNILDLARITLQKLEEWLAMEQKYILYLKYHINNEDYQHNLFHNLVELHRKLIKSYDIDNSIIFISKNIVMESYLSQIQDQLNELDIKIAASLTCIRQEYPRLYLLSNQQLFNFMSAGCDIQKYLRKCFPHITNFGIHQGSIEKVGTVRELIFLEPLYIQQMIGRVSTWMLNLEQMIKYRMKQFYKTSLILSEGKSTVELQTNFYQKYPIQLSILDEFIRYTEDIQNGIGNNSLGSVKTQIQNKIQYHIKQKRQVWKILALITLRDIVSGLTLEQQLCTHSFQWMKYPHFHRKNGQFEPKMSILGQQYIYAFNYLQHNDLIYTDNVLIGNCLVGSSRTGKTAFIRHHAYMVGQQILVFDPNPIDTQQSYTSMLLNYFKVTIYAGNWLYLKRLDLLDEQQLKLAAECLISIKQQIKLQNPKLVLSGQSINLNKNARVFMSIQNLQGKQLPARLCGLIRPVWLHVPNKRLLLQYYLQCKCVSSIEVGKLLKYCCWLDYHGEMDLQLVNWIRREESIDLFVSSVFYKRLSDWHIFRGLECEHLLEGLKKEEFKLSNAEYKDEAVNLQEEITWQRHKKMIIYGQRNMGKTYQVLQIVKQHKYCLINAQNYLQISEFYQIIKSVHESSHNFTYLLLKHSLPYYSLISAHLNSFNVIFIEDSLSHVHHGLLYQIKLLNYQHMLVQGLVENQDKIEYNCLQLLLPKFYSPEERNSQIYQLLIFGNTLFIKIINRLICQMSQHSSLNQMHINFIQLLKSFISQEYQINVSFLFSIFWTYAFHIEQKKIDQIFREFLPPEQPGSKGKFKRITFNATMSLQKTGSNSAKKQEEALLQLISQIFSSGKLMPLTELIPLKKGKFVTSADSSGLIGAVRQIQLLQNRKVSIKSNLIYNISTIRDNYFGTILIDSRDWLSTILKATNSYPVLKQYNFAYKSSSSIFKQLFSKVKRQGNTYSFPSATHIVIDDLHMISDHAINQIKNIVQYDQTVFMENAKDKDHETGNPHKQILKIFKVKNVLFTLGGKYGQPLLGKGLTIRVNQLNIGTIFNQYVQCFCQKYLEVDRSVFCLLNLSNNINRIYRDQQQDRYFWFKNPLILLQQSNLGSLTDFVQNYITYLIQILPEQKVALTANRGMLQLPDENEEGSSSSETVINTTQKYNRFYNQTLLVQQLIADNQILEQIQSKQVQSIFFDKFVRHYFTKQILDYVQRISNYLLYHHLLLLSDNAASIDRIVRYACKVRKLKLIQNATDLSLLSNESAIFIDLQHSSNQLIQNIQKHINHSHDSSTNCKFIIKANLNSNKIRQFMSRYPFLKSHFLGIVMGRDSETPVETLSQNQVSSSKNIIQENFQGKRYVEQLEELANSHGLDSNFKDQFMRLFQLCRKKQLSKFQFYRKTTSEMILGIDLINNSLKNIPIILGEIAAKKEELLANRKKGNEEINGLKGRLSKWEEKQKVFGELVKFKYEEQENGLAKLNQQTCVHFIKLQKIQKKIEMIETVEFTRLKNNLKNNENIATIQPMHHIMVYLAEKQKNQGKERNNIQIHTIIASSLNLANHLRNIRRKQDYQSSMRKNTIQSQQTIDNKRISSSMNGGKIKYFISRMEELIDNGKRYEKVSLVYKSVLSWLCIFQTVCQHLKEYYDKLQEIDAKLIGCLSQLNKKYNDETDIESQKRNLEALAIDSQNNIQQIRERLTIVQKSCATLESHQSKLLRLQRFYTERGERLMRISRLLGESQYMKKISSSVSLYFKNMERIIFGRSLMKISLNQWLSIDGSSDYQLVKGVFTFRSELCSIKDKYSIQNTNNSQEIQIIYNLIEQNAKILSLVEDRNNLIKNKLIELGEDRGYHIKEFRYSNYAPIAKYLLAKTEHHERIILIHDNIYHLEVNQLDNQERFNEFVQEIITSLKAHPQRRIIYIANYLPKLNSMFYPLISYGKAVVSRQRFVSDLCDIFSVLLQKDPSIAREGEIKKRRGDLQSIIGERNSKMKELMSNIQVLAGSLNDSFDYEERRASEIERQRDRCQVLENNLMNLANLQEEAEVMQKFSTNLLYQPNNSRQIVGKELQKYYLLYQMTDHLNNVSNSQFFTQKQFYYEWVAMLKDVREEFISYFSKTQYKPIINEIVIKSDQNQDLKKQQERPRLPEQETTIIMDQVLNHNYRKHSHEIFNIVIERIGKNTNWIEKAALVQYILGGCVIISMTSTDTVLHAAVMKLIQNSKFKYKDEIIQECLAIFKLLGQQFYYEIKIDEMIEQLLANVNDLSSQKYKSSQEIVVFLYLYLILVVDPHCASPIQFINKFGEALCSCKSGYGKKYSFVKYLWNMKLQNQIILRLTPPLNLSLNLQSKLNQKQKIITIIEEQKYLIDDLIQVINIKTLSKKRELISILLDLNNKPQLIDQLKQYYSSSSKYWVLLSNLSVNFSNYLQIRALLEQILSELGKLPANIYFRIFIILNKFEGECPPYYNKYEINTIKSYHQISTQQYFQIINQITLQKLHAQKHPSCKGKYDEGYNLGKSLMQYLIVTTMNQQQSIIAQTRDRLDSLLIFFKQMLKKHGVFREQDRKIYYKTLVWQISKLGYLQGQQNQQNFYHYVAEYFKHFPKVTPKSIKQNIDIQRELTKQGITNTIIVRPQEILINTLSEENSLDKINVVKIQEYFKNINSEFTEMFRKEIYLNNKIYAQEMVITNMLKNKNISKNIADQRIRNYHASYGVTKDQGCVGLSKETIQQRLPLLRFLNNIKLKEICNCKKVQISTSQQFYIFLSAFMYKEIKQFMQQLHSNHTQIQNRYSNGIGLFGNFVSTRDYITKMKIIMIDVDTYQEVPINMKQVTKAITSKQQIDYKFILAIRKSSLQKINELNSEHKEIDQILQRYSMCLFIGGEIGVELSYR